MWLISNDVLTCPKQTIPVEKKTLRLISSVYFVLRFGSLCDVLLCLMLTVLYVVCLWQVLSLVEQSHHVLDKTHLALCMKRLFTLSTRHSQFCDADVIKHDQRFQVCR